MKPMKQKILLVEDDTFLNQLYRDLLLEEGYTVEALVDGKQALERITQDTWDLVLLDVMLPNMDGFTIVKTLKTNHTLPKCPIVFMTNLDSNDDDKEKLNSASGYWIKSNMSPPEFIAKVLETLHRS